MDIRALMSCVEPARWKAWHRACDPDQDTDNYWICASRLPTAGEVLDLVAHVMDKDWVGGTTTDDLLRSLVSGRYPFAPIQREVSAHRATFTA